MEKTLSPDKAVRNRRRKTGAEVSGGQQGGRKNGAYSRNRDSELQ